MMLPTQIRHYQLQELLGRGGMGAVYKAWDLKLEREVALKMIHPELLSNQDMIRRFRQEVETLKNLEHSAIVPLYDFGGFHLADEEPSVIDPPFLVMRFMSGGSLSERIRQQSLSIEEAVRILERVAAALDAVHEKGLVHRDMTPRNVFFDSYNEAYLGDFGLVKSLANGLEQTVSTVGTYAYMSPEQFTGKDMSSQSDIYALGGVLFTMLTSQRPYQERTTLSAILSAHQHEPPPDILRANPYLPAQLNYIIGKAMAKKPEERYKTAQEMVSQLKWVAENPFGVLAGDSSEVTNVFTQTIPDGVLPWPTKRWPRWYFGIAAVLVVALFMLGFRLLQNSSQVAAVTPPVSTPTVQPVIQLTLPPPTPVPYILFVSSYDSSAIWQIGDGELQSIPNDQSLPIPPSTLVRLRSDRDQLVLNLPGQVELHLLPDTELSLQIPPENSSEPVIIKPEEGRFVVLSKSNEIQVEVAEAVWAVIQEGQLGISRNGLANRVEVDCLSGRCDLLEGQERTPLPVGEQIARASNGQELRVEGVDYAIYSELALHLPTPTPAATSTPTPTPTPSMDDLLAGFPQVARIQFGESVAGRPLEVVRIGSGPRRVIFVGGIHAGYGYDAVSAAEGSAAYFAENPAEIPSNVTLYIVLNLNPDSPLAEGEIAGRLNANGVDLNRNWDCEWTADPLVAGERIEGGGGSAPFSEPEVQALRQLFELTQPAVVMFWGSHAREDSYVSPGLCDEQESVSAVIGGYYGEAAGYGYPSPPLAPADPIFTGDVSNWLDAQRIPSGFVLLSRQQEFDLERELDGMRAVMAAVSVETVQVLPTPKSCSLGISARWSAEIGSREAHALGCGLTGEVTTSAGAYQYYNGGVMIWREDNSTVYVLLNGDNGYEEFYIDPNLNLPSLYRETTDLRGAFGFLWTNNSRLQELLGNPIGVEQVANEFAYQDLEFGHIYSFLIDGVKRTFVLIAEEGEERRWFELNGN